ncbi:MAG: UDP-N-acetylglucosamine 2-epimerase (non-hydrolyzing) [Balneolaceae bacterium]
MTKKILIVFGTRPEAIKMAPVVKEFQKNTEHFETKVCVTAQHREMLDQVLDFFEIKPDFDLNLMKPNQNLSTLTSAILSSFSKVIEEYEPDFVYVHGDTTTTFAASLGAFYSGVKICHVEAGLRTFNKKAPFPEEINRQLTGRLADYHFAPTERAEKNLLKEGVSKDKVFVTGNTVIDALLYSVNRVDSIEFEEIEFLKNLIDENKKIVLVTGHRRENFGEGFLNICTALKELSKSSEIQIIYPVHLNPNVKTPVYEMLAGIDNIKLIRPLPYEAFIWLMNKSYIIITDSGGIQEEAPSLGKPVLVMREATERPEAVEAGTVILVGTNAKKIVKECVSLIENENKYESMSKSHNPYGNGLSSKKIIEIQRMIND